MHAIKRTKTATVYDPNVDIENRQAKGKPRTHYAVRVAMPAGRVSEWTDDPKKAGKFDDETALAVVDHYKGREPVSVGKIEVVSDDE